MTYSSNVIHSLGQREHDVGPTKEKGRGREGGGRDRGRKR